LIPISFVEFSEPLAWGCGHPGGASWGHSVAFSTCSAELEGEAGDAGQLARPVGLERVEADLRYGGSTRT
jgi:Flp pilus assembly CpaF family ATPase